jgi:nucleoside-diphosphate-sugar epimerase
MNILVTGANSFIAKNLIEVLTSDQITLFQRSKNDLPLHNNYSIVEYDLYYPKKSTRNLRFIPDIALLFAWNGTRGSQRDRFFLQFLNYYFSKRLILELIRIGTKRFFLAGSQAEYNISIFDKHFSWYGYFKSLTVNWLATKAKNHYDLVYIEGRFFSLYGFGDYNNSLISYIILKMLRDETVLVGCCENLWNYLYIEDAVSAIKKLIYNKDSFGIYDIASNRSLKLKDYIETIRVILGSESEIKYCSISSSNSKKDLFPSTDKLLNDIGYYEDHTFEQGLIKTVSYMKSRGK